MRKLFYKLWNPIAWKLYRRERWQKESKMFKIAFEDAVLHKQNTLMVKCDKCKNAIEYIFNPNSLFHVCPNCGTRKIHFVRFKDKDDVYKEWRRRSSLFGNMIEGFVDKKFSEGEINTETYIEAISEENIDNKIEILLKARKGFRDK